MDSVSWLQHPGTINLAMNTGPSVRPFGAYAAWQLELARNLAALFLCNCKLPDADHCLIHPVGKLEFGIEADARILGRQVFLGEVF